MASGMYVQHNISAIFAHRQLTITNGGAGYTSAPTVTFSGGGATTQATGSPT